MDLLDRLALASRKYQPRRSPVTGSLQLQLEEVLRVFHGKTILDMEVQPPAKEPSRVSHEQARPVSLIDGIAEIGGGEPGWYEVLQTAPSGDYSKVRIVAHPAGGQLSMVVGRRVPEHLPVEDALLDTLRNHGTAV